MAAKIQTLLKSGPASLALIAVICLAAFVWYYPGEAPTGDAAYKYLQVKDFINGGYRGFACDYPGREIDPAFQWFPFQEPMAYIIDGQCFYVFPYQLIFVYLPFYLLAGNVGIYLVSLLTGWLILLMIYRIGGQLGFDEPHRAGLVWFSFAAYGLLTYALGMNEFALTGLLALTAAYCALLPGVLPAVFGGICVGIALQFRAESALLGCTIPAAIWLFAPDDGRRSRAVVFFAVFALILGAFFLANQAVFGHPLGLRGIVFIEGQQQSVLDRLLRMLEYWAGRPTAIFINTPVFVLVPLALWALFRPGSDSPGGDQRAYLRMFGMIAVSYGVVVPLAVANYPGSQFGERFIFNVYPLLGILAFSVLVGGWFPGSVSLWIRRVAILLVAGTVLYTGVYLGTARYVDRGFHTTSRLMEAGAEGTEVIIFRNYVMVNGAFAHFHARPGFLATDDESFHELIARLRAHDVKRVTVAHSSPAYRAHLGLDPNFVPVDFQYVSRSDDLGNELIELRRFEL